MRPRTIYVVSVSFSVSDTPNYLCCPCVVLCKWDSERYMLPGVSFSSISSTGSCRTEMSQQRSQSKSKIRNSPLPFAGTSHVVSEPATSTSGVDDLVVESPSLSPSISLSLPRLLSLSLYVSISLSLYISLSLSLSLSLYVSPFRVDVCNRATHRYSILLCMPCRFSWMNVKKTHQ